MVSDRLEDTRQRKKRRLLCNVIDRLFIYFNLINKKIATPKGC